MPVGSITRGTTNTNRLRRVDRWIAEQPALRRAGDPLVVDLGYGASGVTAFELATRLRRARADVEVLGLEIDPARVRTAVDQLAQVCGGGTHAPLLVYGPSQRWIAVARTLRDDGWPVLGGARRWRLGELTVAWESVSPR